jgi:hypothetical protein
MKTTFDIPDDLFVAAKRAADERVSLPNLVARDCASLIGHAWQKRSGPRFDG